MAFNIWDWKQRPDMTGKLVFKRSNMPPYGKKLYGVEIDNGEIWYFWGTSVLVGELATLPFFTKLKIKFLGKGFAAPEDKWPKLLFDVEILELAEKSKKAVRLEKKLEQLQPPPPLKKSRRRAK